VIVREIERERIPVVLITPMTMVGKQTGANRVLTGTKLPHPCGDPRLPEESDRALRRELINTALKALQTDVDGPTVFVPNITFTS
jgi:betaine reductase